MFKKAVWKVDASILSDQPEPVSSSLAIKARGGLVNEGLCSFGGRALPPGSFGFLGRKLKGSSSFLGCGWCCLEGYSLLVQQVEVNQLLEQLVAAPLLLVGDAEPVTLVA